MKVSTPPLGVRPSQSTSILNFSSCRNRQHAVRAAAASVSIGFAALSYFSSGVGYGATFNDFIGYDFNSATADKGNYAADFANTTAAYGNGGNNTVVLLSGSSASSGYTGASGGNNAEVSAIAAAATFATTDTYFSFTLTPSATTSTYTFTEFDFGTRSTGTGPKNLVLAESTTPDFSTANTTVLSNITSSNGGTWALKTNGLSGLNVTSTNGAALYFGIFALNATGTTSNGANFRIDDVNISYTLVTAGAGPSNLTFTPSTGGNSTAWAAGGTTNFTNQTSSAAQSFTNGDNVTFNNTGLGSNSSVTVTIDPAGVAPGSTTVSNTNGTYIFTGGSIGGSGSLTKAGAGTLVLQSANSYASGTAINGGVLQISNDNQLGATAGGIAFGGGTLLLASGITSTRAITINAGGGTIDTAGNNSTFSGGIGGSDALNKVGAGNLTLLGFATTGTSNIGSLSVTGGSLILDSTAGNTTTTTPFIAAGVSSGSFSGNFVVGTSNANAIRFFSRGGNLSGGGTISVASGSQFEAYSGNSAITEVTTITNALTVGAGGTTPVYFGAYNANDSLTFATPIGGTGDVVFAEGASGLGNGTILLNAASTYSGNTFVGVGYGANSTAGSGVVRLGVDNAMPTTGGLTLGLVAASGTTLYNSGAVDLNGFNQTVAFLATGSNTAGNFASVNGITNTKTTLSTLTVAGSQSTTFTGVIGAVTTGSYTGTNNIGLTLAPTNTGNLTLTAASTYTGPTVIHGGGLILSSTASINNSSEVDIDASTANASLTLANVASSIGDSTNIVVTMGSTATLALNFSGTETVGGLEINGVFEPIDTYSATHEPPDDQTLITGTGSLAVTFVPEPTSTVLLFAGSGLVLRRRRRQKRSA